MAFKIHAGLNQISLQHSLGKLLVKDDPVLMRVQIRTERKATEAFKAQIRLWFTGYNIGFETHCACRCHTLKIDHCAECWT